MSRHLRPILLVVCLFAPARGDDAAISVAPQPGVVLLRNGQVLSGSISQAGEEYYVAISSGEIRLRASQVELVCHSVEEGYERKRARIDPDKVADHLDLALWCVRQQLFDKAQSEIDAARAIDGRHPRITLVEKQLRLARERPSEPRQRPAAADHSPTPEDLDRLLRGMPPGTVETYANTIQPLLLNTCGSGGCHGPQADNKLRLLRTQVGKSSSRRLTQRNLYAVLDMIDRDDPPSSPLLTAPVAPHGTAKAPIFTNKEVVQYRQLLQWVMRVARGGPPEQPASVDTPEDHLSQRLPRPGRMPASAAQPNNLFSGEIDSDSAPVDVAPRIAPPRVVQRKATSSGGAGTEAVDDPFDPRQFNQRSASPE